MPLEKLDSSQKCGIVKGTTRLTRHRTFVRTFAAKQCIAAWCLTSWLFCWLHNAPYAATPTHSYTAETLLKWDNSTYASTRNNTPGSPTLASITTDRVDYDLSNDQWVCYFLIIIALIVMHMCKQTVVLLMSAWEELLVIFFQWIADFLHLLKSLIAFVHALHSYIADCSSYADKWGNPLLMSSVPFRVQTSNVRWQFCLLVVMRLPILIMFLTSPKSLQLYF